MSVRLTPRYIAGIKAGAERSDICDAVVPGLRVRVTSSGVKTFAVWHRVNGRARRFTIGRFPTVTLAEARERARDILAGARRGEDAQTAKLALRRAEDFATVAGRFIEARAPNLARSTAGEYRRMLSAYIGRSRLGQAAAPDICRADVRDLLEDIARSAPVMSNRVFQLIRAVCRWAVREEILETNPCEGLQRPRKERSRERALRDAEIRALWMALDGERRQVTAAVKCLLLLGQRSTETLEMRWEDVDFAGRTWSIPGADRKGGRAHVVPLPPHVVEMLKDLSSVTRDQHRVFAGVSVSNPHRWWNPVRDRTIDAGAEPFTKHDLRRTCATGCARLGASPFIVSRILGHTTHPGVLQVTGIYDRFDRLPEMASALNAWTTHVYKTVRSKGGAEVVSIGKRRASGQGLNRSS